MASWPQRMEISLARRWPTRRHATSHKSWKRRARISWYSGDRSPARQRVLGGNNEDSQLGVRDFTNCDRVIVREVGSHGFLAPAQLKNGGQAGSANKETRNIAQKLEETGKNIVVFWFEPEMVQWVWLVPKSSSGKECGSNSSYQG
jgi:hypothetical protein